MKNNNNMLRNVIILLITFIIIFSTIQHTNVNCAKIEVSVNGDETRPFAHSLYLFLFSFSLC